MYRKRVLAGTRVQKARLLFIYWKDFHIHISLWGEKKIDGNISSEQIYALLDNIDSDDEEE